MRYTWGTRDDGVIVVKEDGAGDERVLTLSGPNAELMERVEARWGDLCRRIGGRYGIPDGYLQAMIWRESGGNEHARNPETKPGTDDDGVGLMQITAWSLKEGLSPEQLEDPEVNVDIGARYLALLIRRYGHDFPKLAAAYNAGSVRAPLKGYENPWGLMSSAGHVTAEVCALNYHRLRPLSPSDREATLALVYSTTQEILAHDFVRGDTDEPPDTEPPASTS